MSEPAATINLVVGTAGHIDHGKTALIKALTGTDTDRLPEEKKRGITIDLGFAELSLGEFRIGFVDVPGHERFVKNMLAGASGIDLMMLVIAADEGVMPQTREHFAICRLLGVQSGLVVITKSDLVDDELLELVRLEAAELVEGTFLENAPAVAVSSRTGSGLDDLKRLLTEAARRTRPRSCDAVARLPIDRSFVVRGFGTVVTGTLSGGVIAESTEAELVPGKRKVRIRGLQSHGREVRSAYPGGRVAVNLSGVAHDEIERGTVLCQAGVLVPTEMFNARLEVLADATAPLRSRQRVRVHSGTAEVLGRLYVIDPAGEIGPGEANWAQIRLERPIAALPGDRFIVRTYSPQATVAGGIIIDNSPPKHRARDTENTRVFLDSLIAARDDKARTAEILIASSGENGMSLDELRSRTGWQKEAAAAAIGSGVVEAGDRFMAAPVFDRLVATAIQAVAGHHQIDPLSAGMPREALRDTVFRHVPAAAADAVMAAAVASGKLAAEGDRISIAGRRQELTGEEARVAGELRNAYAKAGLEPPRTDDALAAAARGTRIQPQHARRLLNTLVDSGELRKVTPELYFSAAALDQLIARVRDAAGGDRLLDIAKFKDIAGVSRKYAIPLLEYLDNIKVTVRSGDRRIIL